MDAPAHGETSMRGGGVRLALWGEGGPRPAPQKLSKRRGSCGQNKGPILKKFQ